MRLIIPLGGRGTRLRPFSHTIPKPLMPVCGRPALTYILDGFRAALPGSVDEVVFVLGPDAGTDTHDQLTRACRQVEITASFAVQPEPLGTAHAIACAADWLEGEILTCWADTLFSVEAPAAVDGADLMAWTYPVDDPRRFGIAERGADGRITRFVEKPPDLKPGEALIGAYYMRDGARLRRILDAMIAERATGAGGEYQLTDAYDRLVQEGARVETAAVQTWWDVGTLESYAETVRERLRQISPPVRGEEGDNLFIPPVYVHPEAVVSGSVLGPYASVEASAQVRDSRLERSVVMAGAHVERSVLRDALVGRRAHVSGFTGRAVAGDFAVVEGS